MRFVKKFTVSLGTTKSEPSTDSIRLIKGILYHVEVAFPPGPAAQVSVVVHDRNLQIIPANPETAFCWDDYTISFGMNYPLTDEPYELILNGWAEDAIYDHNITFRFDVQPTEKDDKEALTEYLRHLLVMPRR